MGEKGSPKSDEIALLHAVFWQVGGRADTHAFLTADAGLVVYDDTKYVFTLFKAKRARFAYSQTGAATRAARGIVNDPVTLL